VAGMTAVVSVAALPPATAQESEALTVEAGDCAELAAPEERLACFDARVEAARQERPASGDRAPAADPPQAPERSAIAADPGSDEPGGDPRSTEIVAKVAELRPTVPNSFVITLDNGQVWRQTQPLYYPLRLGSEVRISETNFGHRLTNPALRGFIRVERVR
jgi:hypothetical protein